MTTPEFVISTMKEMDAKYFTIHDTNFRLVYHQWQNVTIDEAIKRFKNFCENAATNSIFNVGVYQSNLRLKNGEPKEEGLSFEIQIPNKIEQVDDRKTIGMGSPYDITGFAGDLYQAGTKGAIDLQTYLAAKDEIMKLNMEIQQLKMENRYLTDRTTSEMDRLRREYDEKLSSDKKIEGVIGAVLPHLGLGATNLGLSGINGIGTQVEQEVMNTKDKVINAVNVLIKNDPNFATNIEKLAKLVVDKPTIYAMAVQQLNSL